MTDRDYNKLKKLCDTRGIGIDKSEWVNKSYKQALSEVEALLKFIDEVGYEEDEYNR